MSRVLPAWMRSSAFFGLLLMALLGATRSFAQEAHVYVEPSQTLVRETMSVAPGRVLEYRFSLVRGMTLVAEFQVQGGLDNRLDVGLVDLVNFQKYSAGQPFSVFRGTAGTIQNVAKYRFIIPDTSVYYLLLDNRRSFAFARNVRTYVYALSPSPTPASMNAERGLGSIYQLLKQAFVFPDIRISIRHCGLANAYSNPDITFCTELLEDLVNQGLPQASTFVLLHELGHSLLRTWGYPLWDNEDAADEFATMFLMMAKQPESAVAAGRWWASQASEAEARAKVWVNDRHTLSPQRARNIMGWLNQGDELPRRWQKFLVPNMQIEALKSLDQASDGWIDHPLVRAELARQR